MAELVVLGALFLVGKNFVGLGNLLELLLRRLVAGIVVGVIFERELPVRLFLFPGPTPSFQRPELCRNPRP